MKKIYFAVLYVSTSYFAIARAEMEVKPEFQDEPVTDLTEAKEEDVKKSAFTFSGYLDSYYSANFNKPLSRSNLGASNARAFDVKSGEFQLGLVQAKAVYTNSKSEAVMDLTFGPNANIGNYGNSFFSTSLAIKQAYFTYNFSNAFSMTAGQFGTHIGYEVIDAPVNFNYSLSNLFNNGPFYHTGLKATYAFSGRASLMVGVVNNVDGLGDNNRKKGIISQLYFAPLTDWKVYLNFINSNEANPETDGKEPSAFYRVFDITTSYQVNEKFLLGVNAAYGAQKGDYQGSGGPIDTETWGGLALYSNVAITDNFGLGARYEYFNNDSGVRGLVNSAGMGTHVHSFTLSGNITLADGHILVKPELRLDAYPKLYGSSELQQFEDADGNFTKSNQTTFGVAFIYKY